MTFDDLDYPDVTLEYLSNVANIPDYNIESILRFKLSDLMNLRKEEEWNTLRNKLLSTNEIIIEDDILLNNNQELDKFKQFFLKTYAYIFKQHCKCCYIEKAADRYQQSTAIKGYKNPSNK